MIDELYGVFLSPLGLDSVADGSRSRPYGTMQAALAAAGKKRVYACSDGGMYNERVEIGASNSDTRLYGGFKCSDWSYTAAVKATFAPSDGPGMVMDGVNGTLVMEDFAFVAKSVTAPAASSVGAFVRRTTGATFRRVAFTSGDAGPGEDAVAWTGRGPKGADGNGGADACVENGMPGAQKDHACPNGVNAGSGGYGGYGGGLVGGGTLYGLDGGNGVPSNPSIGGLAGVGEPLTGNWSCTEGSGKGTKGADGNPGAVRSGGQVTSAVLDAEGNYLPADGEPGDAGSSGQGGGGGGGAAKVACMGIGGGAAGGSGGTGGCGGKGGLGGKGGGASFAVVLLDSAQLVLDECVYSVGNGGAGGKGTPGQLGGLGGNPGAGGKGSGSSDACSGGVGGSGGPGGVGGGGAGGPAIAIATKGGIGPSVYGGSYVLPSTPAPGGVDGAGNNTGMQAGQPGLLGMTRGFQ